MLPLDSPIWSELSHHFGTGETIPPALQELYNCLADQQLDEDRYRVAVCGLDDQLENIFHQACICPAAGPALPHILALIPRLKLEDQVSKYFACGWIHNEGAGSVYDDEQVKDWYNLAVEKAQKDIVSLANSIELDEDQQFQLFYALDSFHQEAYALSLIHI